MSATVRVRNLGPFDRDIRPGGHAEDIIATVAVGAVVEVSADIATSLDEQDCWQIVAVDPIESE
jgi:hypothetical protein